MKIVYILPVDMSEYGYSLKDFIDTHFSVQIAKEISRQGHTTELYVFWKENRLYTEGNFTIYFIPRNFRHLFNLNFSYFSYALLKKKLDCDVIHFHEPNRLFFIFFRITHYKQKMVAEHHGSGIVNPFPIKSMFYWVYVMIRRLLLPHLLSSCNYYIVHNKRAATDALKYVKKQQIIISGNGINHFNFKFFNKKKTRNILGINNEIIFLFVGRIEKNKGIEELVKAYENIKNNTKLIIAGPLQDTSLKNIVNPYWVGFKSGEELQSLYSAADVFCLPTYFESFGIVIIEALFYNLPLIVSDIPNLREFAKIENTIFTEVGNTIDLENAMKEMLGESKRKSLSKGGHSYVLNSYTWEKICSRYIKLYKK